MRALALLLVLVATAAASPSLAIKPSEILPDPALEARARTLSKEFRCLICQNQSIDDSEADLAGDLRRVVRERLIAGDSDAQVIRFVTERYGDFVLLRPPFKTTTYVLWLGPVILLAVGIAIVWFFMRRRREPPATAAPLSEDEKRRIEALASGGS
jgi:cytochrome c-type biogenesis protein CcmH